MIAAVRARAGLLSALALTVLLGWPAFSWPIEMLDEMILVVLPERILHGDLPYRDFSTVYGPTHWLALSGALGLAGVSVTAERAVGLAEHLLLVAGVYQLLRREGRGLATVGAVTCAFLMFPLGLMAYAWMGFAALLVWSLVAARAGRPLLAGVLAGLALGFRPDALLIGVASGLVLSWPRWRAWGVGLLLGLLPLLVVVGLSPGEFVHDIAGRAIHGGDQSRLPLPWGIREQALLLVSLLLGVGLMVVSAVVTRARLLVALAVVAVLVLPQALQRAEPFHFLSAALLVLPFLPLALSRVLALSTATAQRATLLGAVLAVTVTLIGAQAVLHPLMATATGNGPQTSTVRGSGRSVPERPSQQPVVQEAVDAIGRHMRPGDRVFVWDYNTRRPIITNVTLYYLIRPIQHPFNVELSPGLSNAPGSRVADDVADADLLVLLTPSEASRDGNYPFQRNGPAQAQALIESRFCPVERLRAFVLMRRCP